MKTVLVTMGVALLVLAATASFARDDDRDWRDDDYAARAPVVQQSGRYEWNWDGGDSLTLAIPATTHYVPAGSPRIVITASEDFLSHVRVGNGRIRMERDWRNARGERAEVTITGVTVHNITLAGTGRVNLEKLDLDRLHLTVAGSGALTGEGRVDDLDLTVAGSGDSDLSRLSVRRANIHIAGSGRVALTPRDQANLSVAGSGTVHMAAMPPRISQSIIGSGGVRVDGR
jgi:hypothetical protein